jgi:hypothetical protein
VLSIIICQAQPHFPDSTEIYRDNVVPRIDILIHPDSLAIIYEDLENDHEFPATFIFNNGTLNDTVDEVGFRLRGNTSRYAKKKSFKVSFNTYYQGRKFQGLEKMNLNSEHNDPSIIRSKLCWNILRKMEIASPNANHVEVYINGNYYGLYISVENVDETFVGSRFGNNDGNLYKCLWPADLTWLGDAPDNYKFLNGDHRAYDLSINSEEDDYSDLRDFVKVLHFTSDEEFECAIEEIFNVYDYLKIMVFEMLSGHWDDYIYNKNNFYLYHNTATGKFEFIPYDLDNTFGVDWFNIDWGTRSIYNWGPQESRPLFDRIMAVQKFRDQFSFYMSQTLQQIWNPTVFYSEIDQIRQLISPYVINDPYYPQDYGYTYSDFLSSYNQPTGDHVKYGLKPYILTRYNTASGQVILNDITPVIKYIRHNGPSVNQYVLFRAYSEDDGADLSVNARYVVDEGTFQILQLFDDGQHFDGGAGDRIFGNYLEGFSEPTQIRFQIQAADLTGNTSQLPCEPVLIDITAYQQPLLYINEFMADNKTTIADESGKFNDWLEIYNGDIESVWLGDKYLSDSLEYPLMWPMPEIFLDPGAFILIWADKSPEEGPFHANFKLSKEGEEITIFDAPSLGSPIIDRITYGPQETDISYGRENDGSAMWKYFSLPTPGYSNSSSGISDLPGHGTILKVYPNPCFTGKLNFDNPVSIWLYDLYGRLVLESKNIKHLDLRACRPGTYVIMTEEGQFAKIILPLSGF